MNVIDITKKIGINRIREILNLNNNCATIFFENLESGRSLATALRTMGIHSASQLDFDVWEKLRSWRADYFPSNR